VKNWYVFIIVLLFLMLAPQYNCGMEKESRENFWNGSKYTHATNAILMGDSAPALLFLKKYPEAVHEKHQIYLGDVGDTIKRPEPYGRKISPLQAAFFSYSEPVLNQIFSTKKLTNNELHELLCNAAIIDYRFSPNPTHIYQSTLYVLKKSNVPLQLPCIVKQQIPGERVLQGSLLSVYLSRLAHMPPDDLVKFHVPFGENVIDCLLSMAHEHLTENQFIQFTRINKSNYFAQLKNPAATESPYKMLVRRYVSAHHQDKHEGRIKQASRMNLLFSLFKICLVHIPCKKNIYQMLQNCQETTPSLAQWSEHYATFRLNMITTE
jgi:hypothetical protein